MSGYTGYPQFSVDVSKWVDMAKELAEIAFYAIGYAALERVKELTPVRTGFLRANWQLTDSDQVLPVVYPDKDPEEREPDLGASLAGSAASMGAQGAAFMAAKKVGMKAVGANVVGSSVGSVVSGVANYATGESNAQQAVGETVGGLTGTFGGAKVGAAIGTSVAPGPGTAVGAIVGSIVGGIGGSMVGREVGSQVREATTIKGLGGKLYIVNPVVYGPPVEYGRKVTGADGKTVERKGRGMMAQTISEMPQIASNAVAAVMNMNVRK